MSVQMELHKIIISEMQDQQIIVLKEVDGERKFPIVIGNPEAYAIDRRLKGIVHPRPLTHDLLANVIEADGRDDRPDRDQQPPGPHLLRPHPHPPGRPDHQDRQPPQRRDRAGRRRRPSRSSSPSTCWMRSADARRAGGTLSPINDMSDPEITIRPIRPDDAPQCGRIICEAFTTLQQHHRFPTDFPNADFAVKAVTAMAGQSQVFRRRR